MLDQVRKLLISLPPSYLLFQVKIKEMTLYEREKLFHEGMEENLFPNHSDEEVEKKLDDFRFPRYRLKYLK